VESPTQLSLSQFKIPFDARTKGIFRFRYGNRFRQSLMSLFFFARAHIFLVLILFLTFLHTYKNIKDYYSVYIVWYLHISCFYEKKKNFSNKLLFPKLIKNLAKKIIFNISVQIKVVKIIWFSWCSKYLKYVKYI